MNTSTFIIIESASGKEICRQECTMERAKELAKENCEQLKEIIELRVVNKAMYRIERLAYYIWVDDIDDDGGLIGYVKEEGNFHPYKDAELSMKGGRP